MKLGFIGMGNMATALLGGFLSSGKVSAADIAAYDPNAACLEKAVASYGVKPLLSEREVANYADVVVIACKPYHVADALLAMGEALSGKAILSIALGFDHATYRSLLPEDVRVQFVMPNTPAMVGAGTFLFEKTTSLKEEELSFFTSLFASIGRVETLPTSQMAIGGALSGCGPAFVDLFIEAFADAGVRYGLSRDTALALVSSTVMGAAKLQLETGKHPGELKDMVCSPAGSTIRGVIALEHGGLRSACIGAVEAIMEE